jgi:hypothetical protein
MKKFLLTFLALILTAVFVVPCSMAAETTREIKFGWDDTNIKSEGYFWQLFIREEGGTYNYETPVMTIPWIEGVTEFTGSQSFTVTGDAGGTVTRYFVLRAAKPTGEKSPDSNEVMTAFIVPIGAPFSFTATVIINSN